MAQDMRLASHAAINTLDANDRYIVHEVSKLDTLAGVAIKYGVEVADVKRSNGLVTDFQMFAHKTLRIPVGRRHLAASTSIKPENTSLSGRPLSSRNGSNVKARLDAGHFYEKKGRDKRPLSSAMNLLRGYYGLSSSAAQADGNNSGMEMASSKWVVEEHSDDEVCPPRAAKYPPLSSSPSKSNGAYSSRLNDREVEGKSLPELNGHGSQTEVVQMPGAGDASNERLVRRRFKPDMINSPTETCYNGEIKQDTSILDRMLPAFGLVGGTESSGGLPVTFLKVLDGALAGAKGKENPLLKVRKSSSTSNLQDQTSPQVSLATQKYGLKVEVKSAGSPLNQGGAKPSSDLPPKLLNYRFKAALD